MIFNVIAENTLVISDDTGECIIVDAGNYSAKEDASLSKYIADNGLKPVMAVNTHGHVDHMLGVQYVKDTYGVPFAMNGKDAFLLDMAPSYAPSFGLQVDTVPAIDIDLDGRDEIKFGDTVFKVIETPGHTTGHVCLFNEENKILITGDTLFKESIGRTDLAGGDYSWIMKSILDKIMPLGGDVRFYPGHGPGSTLGHEARYNPFITEVLGGQVNY